MKTVSENLSHDRLTTSSQSTGFRAQLSVVIGDVTEKRFKGQSRRRVHVLGRFWSRHKSSPPAQPNFCNFEFFDTPKICFAFFSSVASLSLSKFST